eukprot:m.170484 g.170484  ORF g.170484 m.170484 type:complete len:103 (-) comp18268_c0_seq16:387-695(-)
MKKEKKHSKRLKKTSYLRVPQSCREQLLSGLPKEGHRFETGIEMQRIRHVSADVDNDDGQLLIHTAPSACRRLCVTGTVMGVLLSIFVGSVVYIQSQYGEGA